MDGLGAERKGRGHAAVRNRQSTEMYISILFSDPPPTGERVFQCTRVVESTSRPSFVDAVMASIGIVRTSASQVSSRLLCPESSEHVAKVLLDERNLHTREEVRDARDPTVE